jgi:hypothetical protein
LRDKINELKGAPTIRSGSGALMGPEPESDGKTQIWQPKNAGRKGKSRRVAK